jgi:ADP-heptose:LPS heptosyltransferase
MYNFGRTAPASLRDLIRTLAEVPSFMTRPKIFLYSLNKKIRGIVKWIMFLDTTKTPKRGLDLYKEQVEKILLVRPSSRMGHLILATPAIFLFRKSFPNARIDFVGSPISEKLFCNLPVDHHFCIRRFPLSFWAYLALIKRIRSVDYDLAVDLSCSESGTSSFIVRFSGARFRVGLQGEWDRWFNVRIPRPPDENKYTILSAFLRTLGLGGIQETFPSLLLSSAEKEKGKQRIETLVRQDRGPIVGVFVGGRKSKAKRWPIKNFCQLITALYLQGANVVTFFGPEEKNLIGFFSDALDSGIPLIFEPSLRDFAAMVSNLDLFITCDSGPMHLACALGTRTVAIFQNRNFDRWGPPPSLAKIVHQPGGCSVEEVFTVGLEELFLEKPSSLRNRAGTGSR